MAWGANVDNSYEPSEGFDPTTWGGMGSEMRKRDYNKDVAKSRKEAAGVYESKKLGAKRTAAYEKLQAAKKELEAMQAKKAQEESTKASEGMSGYAPAGSENPVQDMSEYREQQEPRYNRSYQEPGKTDVEQDLEEDAESPMLEAAEQEVSMFPKAGNEAPTPQRAPLEGGPVTKKGEMPIAEEPLFSTLGEKTYGMPQPGNGVPDYEGGMDLDLAPQSLPFRNKVERDREELADNKWNGVKQMVLPPAPRSRGNFDSETPLFPKTPSNYPNYVKAKPKADKGWAPPEQHLPLFPKRGR